ncbi:histone-lysine N-methyltransferase, H3 lysine-36 specific-like isoform X1 [Psammomys obesus]|uniref:histone-lysine N-methyltransferase, H3 lysine-36 specific-like isoform X1 n=1 Tax=Psammomys obesus TaxID=48139 RepID=UPI002452E61B|nr:histone-lysine N-methyltransferase, H3 lysine-36 specific-like isoform X1 [Psammomys obesus]XP_055464540.1 histone-lysine N-methyltransferase, H3 lysine-36 specific-like isoform X1 [Psammomys obesus]XP_055464541.1 histone-lysine N-methyltransferase, H3 lysine-36 specific-like isoform X1 [Psammomys obesus]XP_055464542.1 histone-lysine N-methyltransferase, H3 lysine-36 specific-like isoform X1 [Psammomys obesus]
MGSEQDQRVDTDDPDSSTSTLGNMLELPGASSSSASQELPFCQPKKTSTPLKYEVGDLIWAKFKRRPWWPCRICSDPLMNAHSKMKELSGSNMSSSKQMAVGGDELV